MNSQLGTTERFTHLCFFRVWELLVALLSLLERTCRKDEMFSRVRAGLSKMTSSALKSPSRRTVCLVAAGRVKSFLNMSKSTYSI